MAGSGAVSTFTSSDEEANVPMEISRGQTAILTGASGGIGTRIAMAFAARGIDLLLVAFPGDGLGPLSKQLEKQGVRSRCVAADLRSPAGREEVVAEAVEQLGRIDILVNNAGVEYTSYFHELEVARVSEVLAINLEAPMMLTRMLLPFMLDRRNGHILNMSSLAGKSGPALQEPYAATKAALVAFTQSLRGSYRGSGVSASVLCPGFVTAGIYERMVSRTGNAAPVLLAPVSAERVARAAIRAIERDLPEVIVSSWPVRPILALSALFPVLGERIAEAIGVHAFFRRLIEYDSEPPKWPASNKRTSSKN
jgi:short-subunit dehydrogenase